MFSSIIGSLDIVGEPERFPDTPKIGAGTDCTPFLCGGGVAVSLCI